VQDIGVPFSRDATSYLISPPGTPFDRLESLQEAMQNLAGASHLAPARHPSRILGVGVGVNHWLRGICEEFPAAFAVGAGDNSLRNGHAPRAGAAVRADLARGLPFADGTFEYVHHRVIPFARQSEESTRMVDELVRVVAPGAWLEIVAAVPVMLPLSPATELLLRQMLRLLDLDPDQVSAPLPLASLLCARGLIDVEERRFELPIGSWGGATGTAMLSNFRATMGAVAPAMEARLNIPTLDTLGMVARSTEEIEQQRTVAPVWFVWGRRGG